MYKLNNDRDFYRVIEIENGYWLEAIPKEQLDKTCPNKFSISPWNGKTKFDVPITCFNTSDGEINYKTILKPNYDYSSDGWIPTRENIK